MSGRRLTRAEFVRLVAGLCRLQRIAFEPELLLQHFQPDADGRYGWAMLFDALDRLGLAYEEVVLGQAAPPGLQVDEVVTLEAPVAASSGADSGEDRE
ncbi:MAG: hypothetical protein HYY97_00030 [Rhodocyclales bacterium]|nr:hypothetical protein [Rhodocyclales bacterium]